MSWVSGAWDWYAKPENREAVKPFLTLLGALVVGVGTITVGALVARAALRQARTAIEQAKTATDLAQIANRQADIASRRHEEQTRADRARRVTDTFSKAVEQLGSEKMEVRIGGIYTLERLAGETLASPQPADVTGDESTTLVPDLYWTVMETLTAFVRERARWKELEPSEPLQQRPKPATDIAAVLEVLRRRPDAGQEREKQRRWSLDLRMTDLRGASLLGAHFEGASLMEMHLERAALVAAHLEGAYLIGAHLEGANLKETHLEGAWLDGAHLEGANLDGAHLEGVDLSTTHGDARTQLPDGVARPPDWPAFEPDDKQEARGMLAHLMAAVQRGSRV